jgi:uncharacterized protein YjiS (DUF1127 family)
MNNSTINDRVSSPVTASNSDTWLRLWIKRWLSRTRHRRQIRRDVLRLMEYDDRTLADIGLQRDDIKHAARYGWLFKRRRIDGVPPDTTSIGDKQVAALWKRGVTKFADRSS